MSSSYVSAQSLMRTGPSRSTLYEVEFNKNEVSEDRTRDYIKLFCRSTSIPAISHDVVTIPGQINQGITRMLPYMSVYGSNSALKFKVIENTDWSVYNALTTMYQKTIVNSNSSNGVIRANYFDEFKFDMDVHKLEFPDDGFKFDASKSKSRSEEINQEHYKAGYKKPVSWKFINCFLTSISSIELSSDAYDTPLDYSFGIMYDRFQYYTETPEETKIRLNIETTITV